MSSTSLLRTIGSYFISEQRLDDFKAAAQRQLKTNTHSAQHSPIAGHPKSGCLRTVMFPENFQCSNQEPAELLEIVIEPMAPADLEHSSDYGPCAAPSDAQWQILENVKETLNRVLQDRLPVRFSTKREPSGPAHLEARQHVAEMLDCVDHERVQKMKADYDAFPLPATPQFDATRRAYQQQFEMLNRFDEDVSHLPIIRDQGVPLPVAFCAGFSYESAGAFCVSKPDTEKQGCLPGSVYVDANRFQQEKIALHEITHALGGKHDHDTQSIGAMNPDLAMVICEPGPGGGGSHMEYGANCAVAGYDSAEIFAPSDQFAESDLCKLEISMHRNTPLGDEIVLECSEKMADTLKVNYGSYVMAGVLSPGAGDVTKFCVTQAVVRLVRHPTRRAWAPTVGSICGHLATLATFAAITGCGLVGAAGLTGGLLLNTGIFSKTVRALGKTIGMSNVAVILIGTIRGNAWPLGVLVGGFLGKLAGTTVTASLEKMLEYAAPLDEQGKQILRDANQADDGDYYSQFVEGDGRFARLVELDKMLAAHIESMLNGKCFTSWCYKTDQDRHDREDVTAGLDEALSKILDEEHEPPQTAEITSSTESAASLRYRGPSEKYKVGIV